MTSYGYFKGKIVSSSGVIGGWTIGQYNLYSNTIGQNNSVSLCTDNVSTSVSIGGSTAIANRRITAGANFGVTSYGTLYASNLQASGYTIG